MLEDAAASYRRALWHDQATEVMIFSEKDAITGVVHPVTSEWDVPLSIVRGYSSDTMAFHTAWQVNEAAKAGKAIFIYQLGDHDPSGVDAWRSFTAKVTGFLRRCQLYDDSGGLLSYVFLPVDRMTALTATGTSVIVHDAAEVSFARLAVTPDQITEMSLPTRPTKQSDSRAKNFIGESVEVDAIPAGELRRIVRDAIEGCIDQEALRLTLVAERSEREILTRMSGDVAELTTVYGEAS